MNERQQSMSPRAWTELLLLAALWGGTFLSVRIALDEIGPLTTVLHRTLWATLTLWGIVFLGHVLSSKSATLLHGQLREITRLAAPGTFLALLVMGILNNVIPFGLMAWGQQHIDSGLTAIFNASTAVFGVAIAAMFLRDERLSLHKGIGVALGFLGVMVAIGIDSLTNFNLASLAQIAVIVGAMSYGFAGVWARTQLGQLPPHLAAAGMLTGSTLVLFPLVILFEGVPSLALELRTWGAVAYLSLAGTALAYLIYYRVLAMAGSGNLMLVTLLIPPFAIILGARVLGEDLAGNAFVGFAILAVGLIVVDGRIMAIFKRRKGAAG